MFASEYNDRDYDILSIAIPDQFIEHGDVPSLRKVCGIDAESVAERIIEHFK